MNNQVQSIYELMQERRNSSVLAMELRLSCINPSTRADLEGGAHHHPPPPQKKKKKNSSVILFITMLHKGA